MFSSVPYSISGTWTAHYEILPTMFRGSQGAYIGFIYCRYLWCRYLQYGHWYVRYLCSTSDRWQKAIWVFLSTSQRWDSLLQLGTWGCARPFEAAKKSRSIAVESCANKMVIVPILADDIPICAASIRTSSWTPTPLRQRASRHAARHVEKSQANWRTVAVAPVRHGVCWTVWNQHFYVFFMLETIQVLICV